MVRSSIKSGRLIGLIFFTRLSIGEAIAQAPPATAPPAVASYATSQDSGTGYVYLLVLIALAGFGAAYFFWKKLKANSQPSTSGFENRYNPASQQEAIESFDFDKELELFRAAKRSAPKAVANTAMQQTASESNLRPRAIKRSPAAIDIVELQKKLKKAKYPDLPINSFLSLARSKAFQPVSVSNDPTLLNAIEQVHDEYEEDESIRELAVRVLAAFKNSNSVDALAQVALYDLSANLRSKAVVTLTDFDHPSVFETILLACADPTREVRATAAHGIVKLSFDRADAWKRIIETGDEYRMNQAARAAIEAGFVQSTFDRLLHDDLKLAGEAFALISLIIKAGELDTIFDAIKNHKDDRVKFALLHVLKVHCDERSLSPLYDLQKRSGFSDDVAQRITDTINSFQQVMA